jgi:hypothetical protein
MTTPPPSGGFGERDWLEKHGHREGNRPMLTEAQRPAAATVFGLALHACHETGARARRCARTPIHRGPQPPPSSAASRQL